MVTVGDIRTLLDDRPELEPAVKAVLRADEPFEFDDVQIDSGEFGELVSHGVVERSETGDSFRVTDENIIRQALSGEQAERADSPDTESVYPWDISIQSLPIPFFGRGFSHADKLTGVLLVVGTAIVAGFRLFSLPAVYRNGSIVLSANDPYYYRAIIEQLATNPAVTPVTLPTVAAKGEPLMIVTLWAIASALGGSAEVIGHVLAWYPVLSAVLTALLLYPVALLVTDDRRVALATVLMLAVLPGHAMRTSLGFADHHAFDYPWLVLTLLGLVLAVVAANEQKYQANLWNHYTPQTLLAVGAVTVGVAGQVLSWEAGPLLIVPVGIFLAADALRAVAHGESPLTTSGPIVVGITLAAALTWTVHVVLDWHTVLVASAPALLAVGGASVLVAATLIHRSNLTVWTLVIVEVTGFAVGVLLLRTAWPEFWARLTMSITQRLLTEQAIAEVRSLFSQAAGWLLLFGFILLLASPYLVWSLNRAREDARWLPLGIYGLFFMVLATIQVRFVGELSPVIAVFAGLAFIHVAAWIGAVRQPAPFNAGISPTLSVPDRNTVQTLALLFILVAGLSVVQVPIKTGIITTGDGEYQTAQDIATYSESQNLEYPENYVFSRWGENRMYNYFVSGQATSYSFARDNYRAFISSNNENEWYNRLGSRRGFVVTTDAVVGPPMTLGNRLHAQNGSHSPNGSGVGHYRLIATNQNGSYKVFAVVPGAIIKGSAQPNTTLTVEKNVTIENTTFTYTRQTEVNAQGRYGVRVAYPGAYKVGNTSVSVSEAAVQNGSKVVAKGA